MKKPSFWPVAIAGIFAAVVVAIVFTLYFSMLEPLEYDDHFDGDFEYVKRNFLRLEKDSEAFEACCRLIVPETFAAGENLLSVAVLDEEGKSVEGIDVTAWLTRPATGKYDVRLGNLGFEAGGYVSSPFDLETSGVWQLQLLLKFDGLEVQREFRYEFPVGEAR